MQSTIWQSGNRTLITAVIAMVLGVLLTAEIYAESPPESLNLLNNNQLAELQSSRQPLHLNQGISLKSNSSDNSMLYSRKFLPVQLYDDFSFFIRRPDFYAVVGGLALAPTVFKSKIRNEEPKLTEMWGNSQFADDFFEFGESYGQAVTMVGASVAAYALGKWTNHEHMRSFGSDLFRAQLINGFFTSSMKGLVKRQRPNRADNYSYPSGHTSSAFTTAGVVYSHFGKYYGIPAFALASYVGMSRLQENKHYLSDVVAGAILGTYIGMNIVRDPTEEQSIKLSPSVSNGAPGLKLTLKF